MTFREMYEKILEICPFATMGEDNDGQLVIYTDLMLDGDGESLNVFVLEEEPEDPNDPILVDLD